MTPDIDINLKKSKEYILKRNILKAINSLKIFLNENTFSKLGDRLSDIEQDYELMLEYMYKGYKDNKREEVYTSLLVKMYRLLADTEIEYKKKIIPIYISAGLKSMLYDFQYENIHRELENFVSESVIIDLEPENVKNEKKTKLYYAHQEFIKALFDYILVSNQWRDEDVEFWEKLLLSPTILSYDVQIIISAIMMSTMNEFDICKLRLLIHIYMKSTDEYIRQRALIAWVFAINPNIDLFPEQEILVADLCKDDKTSRELLELQMQMFFCLDAEKDNAKIQQDIMPNLIKNNQFNVTRFGIEEKEDDAMQDIFDPGASDRAMEEVEQSINKMMEMQKAGSDIYFGGFSQMKHFGFFQNISNWFCPFYIGHPGIKNIADKLGDSRFLNILLNNGPFCDSDKYSFALAMASIIDKIPDNLKQLLNNEDAIGPTLSAEEMHSPAYIRRMYLQDLYRFFRIYPQRNNFVNPFDSFFFNNELFISTGAEKHIVELCSFLFKRKEYVFLTQLLDTFKGCNDENVLVMRGYCKLEDMEYDEATNIFHNILEDYPYNESALRGLARSSFLSHDYEQSVESYSELFKCNPENRNIALNYCMSLIKVKDNESALNILYKLNYEYLDDINVIRVLAWALLAENKLEQAETEYNKLLKNKKITPSDYINAGYCQWFKGNVTSAVKLFRTFVNKSHGSNDLKESILDDEFANNRQMIHLHGISEIEVRIMIDICNADFDA